MKLSKKFYLQNDVLDLSQKLLGKILLTQMPNSEITGGIIIETEAYKGPEDKASHAYLGRRTKRTEPMFAQGGIAYVYLCYGLHVLFNIVTNKQDIPHAVLIRAIHPIIGLQTMLQRRKKSAFSKSLTAGPGSLSQALGIELKHSALDLTNNIIWLEDHNIVIPKITVSPRIGIDYAEEYALKPWRFQIEASDLPDSKTFLV